MQADLIFSGVPKGEDFFGPSEDKRYFSTFYTGNRAENKRFLVEVRRSGAKEYCYYNYLISNTTDVENRAGGYFCMSLRLDMFCKDVVNMYRFMDLAYSKYVANNILVFSTGALRYQITTFEQQQTEIQSCQNCILNMIREFMSGNDFVPIDSSFNLIKSTVHECNFCDCTRDNVLNAIKKYAAISCSTTALLQREQSAQQVFDSRLASATRDKEKEISNANASLQAIKAQYAQLQSEASKLRDEIEKLKKDIKQKDAEIRQNSLRQNVSQIVNQIKEPINKLASITGQGIQETLHDSTEKRGKRDSFLETIVKKVLPILNFIVLLGIGACLFWGFNPKSATGNVVALQQHDNESVPTSVTASESSRITEPPLDNKTQQTKSSINEQTIDAPNNTTATYDFSKVFIDIQGYSGGGPLQHYGTYSLTIKRNPADGEWRVDNLVLEESDAQNAKIRADFLGKVRISYYIDNQLATSRELTVQ